MQGGTRVAMCHKCKRQIEAKEPRVRALLIITTTSAPAKYLHPLCVTKEQIRLMQSTVARAEVTDAQDDQRRREAEAAQQKQQQSGTRMGGMQRWLRGAPDNAS